MTLSDTAVKPVSYQMYINGRWVDARDGQKFDTSNPATGEVWARIAEAAPEDVDDAVKVATEAFYHGPWSTLSATKRGRLLMRLANLVEQKAEHIANIETRDNGKLYKEMIAQLHAVPNWLIYYGGLADKVEGSVIPIDRTSILNYTLREPLGVVGAITPWNSPVILAVYKLAPALAAGNTLVIKPSEFTSASTLEFAKLIEEAGFPPGVVNIVTGHGENTGHALASHPGVAKVSFTGSVATGRKIASVVAARGGRYSLELGGKSPNIVFDDAILDAAEAGLLSGIFAATGQTCVAGSRALIQRPIFDEICERITRRASTIQLGDPMDPDTQMGPVANPPQLSKVEHYVSMAKGDGATLLEGGDRATMPKPMDKGLYFKPTVFKDVPYTSKILQEEVFGPVLCLMPFDTEDDAAQMGNDTEYGLAAGIWTRDIKRAHRLAKRLEAGTVWINTYRFQTFNAPHGGFKASGIGKENGQEAIEGYLQTKSVMVETSDEIQDPFVIKL